LPHPDESSKTQRMSDSKGLNEHPSSRTTRHSTPNRDGKLSMRTLRRSTRLSVYLYICAHYKLSDEQREYVAYFQAKLNLSEIQSALKFMHTLTTDRRTRARMQIPESQEIAERLVPTMRPRPVNRDQRRIGVGYRDKGSLPKRTRPDWEKDNTLWVGLTSQQEATKVWDLTILGDPPEELNDETAKGSVATGVTPSERIQHPALQGKLEQTGPGQWKISLPKFSWRSTLPHPGEPSS